jgi:hypothetical protein
MRPSLTLADAWLDFERLCVPPDLPAPERRQYRRLFYAGAKAFLSIEVALIFLEAAGLDDYASCMEVVHRELRQFRADVKEGRG